MSAQSSLSFHSYNHIFDQLPEDATASIFKFLKKDSSSSKPEDDRAVIATAAVCRNWKANLWLTKEREEAVSRLIERVESKYPPEIRQIFRDSDRPIVRLPRLELDRDRDYIDWLNPGDLSEPVMRFIDSRGRPGIVFSLQYRRCVPLSPLLQSLLEERSLTIQDQPLPTTVLAIFRRQVEPESHWTFGNDGQIDRSSPNDFPQGYLVNPIFIRELLTGQHRLYRII